MNLLLISIVTVYLVSYLGSCITAKNEYRAGRYNTDEYISSVFWAKVPVINTLILVLGAAMWIVYRLSYGMEE
jgi:cytochrome b subunit of formate dehydrogenase